MKLKLIAETLVTASDPAEKAASLLENYEFMIRNCKRELDEIASFFKDAKRFLDGGKKAGAGLTIAVDLLKPPVKKLESFIEGLQQTRDGIKRETGV